MPDGAAATRPLKTAVVFPGQGSQRPGMAKALLEQAAGVSPGGMAAVLGRPAAEVESACAEASTHGVVQAVNYNAPGQTVIAGEPEAVSAAPADALNRLTAATATGVEAIAWDALWWPTTQPGGAPS